MYVWLYNMLICVYMYMLLVTCYLIGLDTSINLFIDVFGRAFNVLLGTNLCFELSIEYYIWVN